MPIHVGGGCGGDPTGCTVSGRAKFTERVSYDMTDPAIVARSGFGVIDHVGHGVWHEAGRTAEGWGLFEHGALGRHDPSGFADWLTVAPDTHPTPRSTFCCFSLALSRPSVGLGGRDGRLDAWDTTWW